MADQPRAQAIYSEALARSEEERESYLDAACGDDRELRRQVVEMLAAKSERDGLLPEAPSLGDSQPTVGMGGAAGEFPGAIIGPYRLLEQLGEGGFGSVWLAQQQEPIRRQVALKIIKAGMDSEQVIGRFEAERQTLALLDHPGIAKVFDAGTTERGRPYFVMELVKGEQILKYCDRAQLDTRARLDLLTKVCQAIQHAHQKGIIHRDIKPGNVLVTVQEGVPVAKVIDFGIAKATSAEMTQLKHFTLHNEMIGTPLYMSPEQAAMTEVDIDTRSDIYSLGVLLYELLTGVLPFDAEKLIQKGFVEMMWVLREGEPPLPSTRVSGLGETAARFAAVRRSDVRHLASALRGDLDWIVMRCLEKDRERRYETAGALAEDIRRHLGHEPVAAGPPSAGYRLRKFARRNRTAVAAGLLVAAAMVLGAVGATWGLIQSRREQARTAAALAELEQVTAFQAGQLSEIDTRLMGVRLREDIVAKRQSVLKAAGLGEPSIAARLTELDSALTGVNFTDVALKALDENIFERALATIEQDFADRPLIKARLLESVANSFVSLGLLSRATEPHTEALALRRSILGPDHPDTLQSLHNVGRMYWRQGRLDQAADAFREAMEGRRRSLGTDHPDTLASINAMGVLLRGRGELVQAEVFYREALEGRRRALGETHPDTLASVNNLGLLLREIGEFGEAERLFREVLTAYRETLGDEHRNTLAAVSNLGTVLLDLGKLEEAEPLFREVLTTQRLLLGSEHPNTLSSISSLASLLRHMGGFEEAEELAREALQTSRRVLGNDHPVTMGSMTSLGVLLRQMGRDVEAEPLYREALATSRRVLGNDHPRTLYYVSNLGFMLQRQGKAAEAEPILREALAGRQRILGDEHPDTLTTVLNLGELLLDRGRFKETASFLAGWEESLRRRSADGRTDDLGYLLLYLGRAHAELGGAEHLAVAEQKLEEAHALLSEALGSDHPSTVKAGQALVTVQEARRRP